MKKKHSSELYASLGASNVESNSGDFEVLSLRISHRSNAMVQALTAAFQRPVLTLFTDGLSQQIARSLLGSVKNEPLIREEVANGIQSGSALDLLNEEGAIKYASEALRAIKNALQTNENRFTARR
jgi:hypothetical protein